MPALAPAMPSSGTAPAAAPDTAPGIDSNSAVVHELFMRLGQNVHRYTPQQLADAARQILANRQAAAPSGPPAGGQPMADTSQQVSQRPDVSAVSAPSLRAGDPFAQRLKQDALNVAQMIGNAANAARYSLTDVASGTTGLTAATSPGGGAAAYQALMGQPPPLTPEQEASIRQGVGVWASMAVGNAAAVALPVVPGIINKATNYTIASYFGAAAFQAPTAPQPGETRLGHIFGAPTAQMALAGVALGGIEASVFRGAEIPSAVRSMTIFPASKQAAVADGGRLAQDIAHATAKPPPSTPLQKAPDALRSLTDEQLAAHPLGQTPPLAQSAAAPGVLDAQVHAVSQGVLAKDAMSPQVMQQAMKQSAIEIAVAHTPAVQIATPDIQGAVADVIANPPTANVGDLATRAFQQADPDAHFAAHIGDHITIPPETQLPPLIGDIPVGTLPSLTMPQTLQYLVKSQEHLDAIVAAVKTDVDHATQETLGRMGSQAGFALAPVLQGGVGFGLSLLGDKVEDEHPAWGTLLHTAGRLMYTSAVLSAPGSFWAQRNFSKNIINALDATVALSQPGARDAAEQIGRALTYSETDAAWMQRHLTNVFGPEGAPARRAFAYISGPSWNKTAHWESLNPAQQAAAEGMLRFNHDLGALATSFGVLAQARDNYMHVGFIKGWYDKEFGNRQGGADAALRNLSQTGGWAKHGMFPDLASAENWLQTAKPGIDPERALNHDGVDLSVGHYRSVMRAIHNKALTDAMQHLGYLLPKQVQMGATTDFTPNTPGWKDVNVLGWTDHEAPVAVANLLETMANRGANVSQVGRYYDLLSGMATRAVIYNRYIHAMNLVRRGLFAGVGIDGYAAARDAYNRNDPGILTAAGYGVIVRRGSVVPLAARAVDEVLAQGGHSDLTTWALSKTRGWLAGGDKLQDWIGTLAYAKWTKEVTGFSQAHPEILPGSPEWDTNMYRIAKVANDAAGRVPTWFRSPTASKILSRAFLAPQFLETRWNNIKGGIDDTQAVLAGGLAPTDALYAKFKMRQLAVSVIATVGLSYLFSHKPPVFNPQTGKFTAQTGLKDSNGNDIGFDPTGEGQAELTALGNKSPFWPLIYLAHQVNPLPRVLTQLYAGHDQYGRQLSGPEAVENAWSNLGGLAQGAQSALRFGEQVAQGQAPTAGEVTRAAVTSTGLAGFSTLDQQVAYAGFATKQLIANGLPATGDQVWNLTRLMLSDARHPRSNRGGMLGPLSASYIANEQRMLGKQFPGSWLWYMAKRQFSQMVE